jgi:hypothetical protein
MITTSPCRSTKCEVEITNASRRVIQGVTQTRFAHAQSTHCTSPPSAPPTTTKVAAVRL